MSKKELVIWWLMIVICFTGGYVVATIDSLSPPDVLHCKHGNQEDSCKPDYIGDGRWVLRKG